MCCSMETITLGDKRIGIKTSVLEEKATACNMLCCYADELKEGFYPWIDQVSEDNLVFLLDAFNFRSQYKCIMVYCVDAGCPDNGSTVKILFP